MQEQLGKRSMQLALGAAVLLIWGYNMLSIAGISADDKEKPDIRSAEDPTLLALPDFTPYEYTGDFRDPFRPQLQMRPVSKPVKKVTTLSDKEQVRFPELLLRGVIGQTAMIQNRARSVFFANPGDTVEQSVVRTINPDSVMLEYKGKSFTISLNK